MGLSALVAVAGIAAVVITLRRPPAGDGAPSLSSYRIAYTVEEPTTGTQRRQVVEVARPYRARTLTFEADGSTLISGNIWTENGLYVVDRTNTVSEVQPVPPGRPGPDVRLDISLPEAVAADVVEKLRADVVAGLPCTWYRSRGPLDSDLPSPATDNETTLSCVDFGGRILADEWSIDDRLVRRRMAASVETGISLDDQVLFGPSGPNRAPTSLALTAIRELAPGTEPPLAVPFPVKIAGMPLDRLVEVADLDRTSGLTPTRLTQWATYTDGRRLVILSQSRALTVAPLVLPEGEPFELAPLQGPVIGISFDGLTVTGMVGDVQVEIRGPIARADFAAIDLTP